MAQLLLGGAELPEALTLTARRVAEAIGAPWASIELGPAPARARTLTISLRDGDVHVGTLVVPDDLPPASLQRLRAQILPALTSIVVAALARDRLQAEVVETASLRRSDEMKTAALRSVSHDLRTPMTAILSGIAALRASRLTDDERDANLAGIDEGATRLGRLIEKLLALSRLQAGMAEPRPAWCSVDEVLHEAAESVAVAPQTFAFSVDRELPLVRADAGQLERAFANLLENAARYSDGMAVSVRARAVGRRLVVRVVDRGPGIAASEQQRVFSAFYRSPDAPAEHRGSGLGLAIAKGCVEANGGRIWVESLPRQGTSFVVELPLEPVADELPRPARAGR